MMGWFKRGFNPEYITVSQAKLRTLLPRQLMDSGRCFFYDDNYKIPLDPAYIMRYSPADKLKHNFKKDPDEGDCNQRMKVFRGWLAGQYLGTLMGFEIIGWLGNERHCMPAFLDLQGIRDQHEKCKLMFGDLQQGRLMYNSETKLIKIDQLRC